MWGWLGVRGLKKKRGWNERGCRLASLVIVALAVSAWAPARAALDTSLMAESLSVARNRASDLVWGRNTKGPYTLSRRLITPGSETVYVNGARAFRPADYQIDYTAGTITFAYPLPSGQVARVDYVFDPKKSTPNLRPLTTPLSLDLAELRLGTLLQSTLQFNGVWKMPESGTPTMSAIGMGLSSQLGQSTRVSSLFAFTPRSAREGKAEDDWDAASVQVSAETHLKAMQARANFLRTGRAFAAAKEYKQKKGTQLVDLSTAYTFNKNLVARSSLQRTEELASEREKPSRVTTVMAHEVAATVSPSSKVTLGRTARQVETGGQIASSSSVDRVQLDQRLGQKASAQVRHEVATNEAAGKAEAVATTGVKMEAHLTPGTRVTAERVEARAEEKGPAASTQVGVVTAVPGGLRLEGRYAQSQAPDKAPEEVRMAKVEAAPLKGLTVGGGVVQQQVGTQETIQKQANVEVKSRLGLQVAGRFQSQADEQGRASSIVRHLDARLKPMRSLEVGGIYTDREQQHGQGPLTRGLSVTFSPLSRLQISGSVTENPEEQGKVRPEERRSVNLRSHLGALQLTGGYSQRLTTANDPIATELEIGLALQIGKYDRLFGSYKVAEQFQAKALATQHYRLGYTRWIGNTFGLSLEGEYLRTLENNQPLSDRSEARAKAGLNMRF